MSDSYRNKPGRDKRNRTRKERKTSSDVREIPQHVWKSIQTPRQNEVDFLNRYNGKLYDTITE